ncbi:MAG: SurA N-terminal domain-containing protein [Ectothiorhodospiraceae bacterium]|nr:SurA N-terminal domain-containing protein [Ectothiorhodospiraceae bacterium]
MLLAIREHIRGWLAWIIIILIGAAFALVGLSSYMGPSGGARVVAEVNGSEITRDQLDRAFSQRRAMYDQLFDGALPQTLQEQLRRDALEELITEHLIRQYVVDRGFRVSDRDLGARIRADERFHADGRFSPELYRRMLSQQGLSPERFEQMMRQQALLDQLSRVFDDTAIVTEAELERAVALRHQQRELRFAELDYRAWLDQVDVTDDAVAVYYEENASAFQSPERVRVQYVQLDEDAVRQRVDIEEDALARYFERVRGRYVDEETRWARHILIAAAPDAEEERAAARELLEELRERIQAGESFSDLAREYSDDPGSARQGGDLGEVERGLMVEPFEEALFSLEPGALSEPVETRFGVHLIRLDRVRGGSDVTLDDVRDELRQELASEQAGRLLFELRTRMEELAFDWQDTLEPVAEDLELELRESDWFTREGGDGIAAHGAAVRAAFSEDVLEHHGNSDVIELEDGSYVVLRVSEHEPSEQLALEQVEDEVREQLQAERAYELATERAQAMVERLEQGEALEELAAESPALEVRSPGYVTRQAEVPGAVLREAFGLPRVASGEQVAGIVELGGGRMAVLQVTGVRDGNPEALDSEILAEERQRLRQLAVEAAIQDFIAQLRADASVTIHEERLL